MTNFPADAGRSYVNVRLLTGLTPAQPLALLRSFREADSAALEAERVLQTAAANLHKGGTWATQEQLQLAATLRATADQLFKVTMREWGKLDRVQNPAMNRHAIR